MSSPLPETGQIVRVRTRTWVVESTDAQGQSPDSACVHLSCLDDNSQGTQLSVLWTLERDAKILGEEAWKSIGQKGFDDPRRFGAFLHTLRWNCVTATDPKLFQSPFRAGIRLDAYQLEPLAKALQMPRVNLFIADDVGLGKTIEAGLIASELLLRRRLREVVVAAPPSMLIQWQEELDSRFGLTFQILDREYVESVRRTRGFGVNPWTTFPRFLVSHRLLAEEAYMSPLRDWLGTFRPSTMLILDEAHHAAPASGSKYAIDSKLTESVRDLAGRFEHRLFLSATPHNGHPNSFSALLEILDPNRFTRGVKVNPSHVKEVMVRRLKEDIREVAGGFPQRDPVQVDLDGLPADAPELKLAELLGRYWDLREKSLETASKRQQMEMGLLLSGLQQRLFSSVDAFTRTLTRHRGTMERIWAGDLAPTTQVGRIDREALRGGFDSEEERGELGEEEQAQEEDDAVESATRNTVTGTASAPHAEERALLAEMDELAQKTRYLPDARVRWLVEWIRNNQCAGASLESKTTADSDRKWNDLRLIIFTEYEDTRRYLVTLLQQAISRTDRADERIMVYHGPTPPERREEIKRAFNAPPTQHPVRILVCTDAAREGLNLQAHCWNLVHFDVPWNPSRMEQRNGRIDRKLQPNAKVYCHYFVYAQRPEDRILQTLVQKTETIRRELGSLSKVLDNRLALTLEMGIRRGQRLARLSERMEEEERALRAKKDEQQELEEHRLREGALLKSIDGLRNRLDQAKKWIGLDNRHLKDCLDASLEMQGVEPLQTVLGSKDQWTFPDLDRHYGADPSWASTLKTLREREFSTPSSERKPFQKAAVTLGALKPVTLTAPESVDDSVVQLHLEHRVVKRLLSRFLSQEFLHHDLSRACLGQTKDSVPRVILLGRLSVHGSGAARLHEELVPITARWIDPARREGTLRPFARDAEIKTLEQLEESLLPENRGASLDKVVQDRLQASCARDIGELVPHLAARADEILETVKSLLSERAVQETSTLRGVLEDQRKRVQSQLDSRDNPDQQELSLLDPLERRTFENNRRYWSQWLSKVEETLDLEPARIAAFYTPRSFRIEPVGLAYLWPVTG
jgi:superfamily II DNA/RNA helicase